MYIVQTPKIYLRKERTYLETLCLAGIRIETRAAN